MKLAMLLSVIFATGSVFAAENRAVQVEIYGRGPAVDRVAYEQVRRVFGDQIASGVMDKFVVKGYGDEGGFLACGQLTFFTNTAQLDKVVAAFKAIRPDPQTTDYAVKPVPNCD